MHWLVLWVSENAVITIFGEKGVGKLRVISVSLVGTYSSLRDTSFELLTVTIGQELQLIQYWAPGPAHDTSGSAMIHASWWRINVWLDLLATSQNIGN